LNKKEYYYGTHLPHLLDKVMRTSGPILELGAGEFSTPILEVFTENRLLITVESDPKWQPQAHMSHYVYNTLEEVLKEHTRFSVALIDGPVETRRLALDLLVDKCEYLILHDTEDAQYRYELSRFKEPWVVKQHREDVGPSTAVLWKRKR